MGDAPGMLLASMACEGKLLDLARVELRGSEELMSSLDQHVGRSLFWTV
jgi:hypothetical protein